jgi:hypothetical protein
MVSMGEPLEALRASLIPGTVVERYGRPWRLGRWSEEDGVILGRIGFEDEPGVTEIWSDELKDFREQMLPAGVTSPFAIRVKDLQIAFQLRPGKIRPTTFTGAFQGLLNEASEFWRWRVERDVLEVPWEDWLRRVKRVTELSVTLYRPNPNYRDRDRVEELIEGVRARVFTGTWRARPDDPQGIDLTEEVIREAIEHAEEHGRWAAEGEVDPEADTEGLRVDLGGRVRWRSDETAWTPQAEVPADPMTGEARGDALRDELEVDEDDPDA